MPVQDILFEINSLQKVGGSILCTSKGEVIAKEISPYLSDYVKEILPGKIKELVLQLHVMEEDFIQMNVADTGYKWVAKKGKNLIIVVILYPECDLHLVKLHLDLAMNKLSNEKDITKILSKQITLLITMLKKVHVWDIIKLKEYLEREGLKRGLIITQIAYDNKVKDELLNQDNMIEIVISDNMKEELKKLTKKFADQGYIVKKVEISADRWM